MKRNSCLSLMVVLFSLSSVSAFRQEIETTIDPWCTGSSKCLIFLPPNCPGGGTNNRCYPSWNSPADDCWCEEEGQFICDCRAKFYGN